MGSFLEMLRLNIVNFKQPCVIVNNCTQKSKWNYSKRGVYIKAVILIPDQLLNKF
jgi:hypothetical protein